jgi:hypothetical protein
MYKSIFPEIGISLLTLLTYGILFIGLRKVLTPKAFRNTVLVLLAWAAALTGLSLKGFFADFSQLPPRPPLAIFLPLPIVLYIAFSRAGTELLRKVPPQRLIYLQSFRIGVELLLWINVTKGLIPVQMSFEGRNFDIGSGLLALPVAYYCLVKKSWPRQIILLYNLAGLALLLNVMIIAFLSMPTPLRYFHNEPSLALIGQFPFIFLPGLLVPLAYTLHIFSLRQYYITLISFAGATSASSTPQ